MYRCCGDEAAGLICGEGNMSPFSGTAASAAIREMESRVSIIRWWRSILSGVTSLEHDGARLETHFRGTIIHLAMEFSRGTHFQKHLRLCPFLYGLRQRPERQHGVRPEQKYRFDGDFRHGLNIASIYVCLKAGTAGISLQRGTLVVFMSAGAPGTAERPSAGRPACGRKYLRHCRL